MTIEQKAQGETGRGHSPSEGEARRLRPWLRKGVGWAGVFVLKRLAAEAWDRFEGWDRLESIVDALGSVVG